MEGVERYTWKTGKVISISVDDREKVIENLIKKNIYPIGRFGLWNRKLLVDNTIGQAKMVADCLFGEKNNIIKLLSK